VFVALGIQHVKRMLHIGDISGSTIFCTKRFSGTQELLNKNVCFDFLYNCAWNVCFDFLYNCAWNISHSWSCMYIGLHIKYRSFLSKTLEFSRRNFEKYPSIKFNENPSIGSRVVPCGQTDRHTWQRQQPLFATLRTRLTTGYWIVPSTIPFSEYCGHIKTHLHLAPRL
jgi:hypothetical protein